MTTLNINSGAETALWPADWISAGSGNRALLGVGNDDVTVYYSGTLVRLALTDYSSVEVLMRITFDCGGSAPDSPLLPPALSSR